ncbi:MAG: hypothetical protein KC621_24780, partial [Myxococcales bacterium]|nr:hypothetical protein [Myxococcales bacterium]
MESRAVLDAGGILADARSAPADLPVDEVDARAYRHPAIADRVVVRLVPRSLDAGSDTWMGTFAFGLDQVRQDLGVQRRRTLGFPWWTLVHEPEHAALVLAQQPAFRKARRLAASKPGHAKDALTELAREFERRAPGILPTFWEEAGRAFIDLGNPKMAATCFDKGRAAEATFGLSVDQERLGDVFLEFALAGAVTVKSLQAWAKQLSTSVGAAQAWDRFRALAIRRTLGGMPPWASFAKDLSGLAKAAGRDVEVERRSWLEEILGAPALDRATPTFWKEHYGALADLAENDPEIRRRWLSRFPKAGASSWSDVDEGFADTWLGELHRAGVLSDAWTDPAVDPARWLKALLDWAPDG